MAHRPARLPACALLTAVTVSFAGCEVNLNSEGVVARETKRFNVSGRAQLQLETFDGAIEVHSWDRKEVEVEVEKRAMEQSVVDGMTVTAEQQGDRIVVKVSGPPRREFEGIQVGVHFGPSAKLIVALPRDSEIEAVSRDGSITIEDVAGKISLTTSDGSIRGSRLRGAVTARSGDGSIRMERIEGELDLETDDGSITLEARPTVLRARTSDGTIRLDVDPDSVMAQDWDVQTADGSVTLTLPGSFDAEIDAETRDGSVRASHPAISGETRDGESREERRRTLKATLGAGGRTLKVRTGDGTIRIES